MNFIQFDHFGFGETNTQKKIIKKKQKNLTRYRDLLNFTQNIELTTAIQRLILVVEMKILTFLSL